MHDKAKHSGATKRYQNPSYPSGSFERALETDRRTDIGQSLELRLERHPSMETDSAADLEEMVPAFMRRDFFRTPDDGIIQACDPATFDIPERSQTPHVSTQANVPSPISAPPQTEPIPALPHETTDSPSTSTPPAALRNISATPSPPLRSSAPLRSSPFPPATPPLEASSTTAKQDSSPSEGLSAPQEKTSTTAYTIPLTLALTLILGILLWREGTRPTLPEPTTLPLPHSVTIDDQAQPVIASTQQADPHYVTLGPPLPSYEQIPASSGLDANPNPDDKSNAEGAEAQEIATDSAARSSALKKLATTGSDSESPPAIESQPSHGASQAGDLFPDTADDRPQAHQSSQSQPVSKPPRPQPSSQPSAPKAKKAAPVAASAADLFPLEDDAVAPKAPRQASPPKGSSAPEHHKTTPSAPPAPRPAIDLENYNIAEPNL